MKQIIKLTEGDLHSIVKETVQKILREYGEDRNGSGQEFFGKIAGQAIVDGDREKLRKIDAIARSKGGGSAKSLAYRRGMISVMDDPNNSNKLSKREHNKRKGGA